MVSKVETNPVDFTDFGALHALLSAAFAPMEGRIDPPSSMTRLSVADVAAKVRDEDLFVMFDGARPVACLFGAVKGEVYYIGKLAVAAGHRGRGLSRRLVEEAARHASGLGHPTLELQTRVELTSNHAVFRALGFEEVARTAHPGHSRPTSITFRRPGRNSGGARG
ncbi:GNAT family N-acetyltransferase [Roseibacterium sp. SDUM158017]|uniref:GNAT family N-acetyltransferase n=1 Tax=Roseicyclus salinarum TaxID=3036773 RepID=UPI0024151439|nr:GNAT family N-acetyltransferase [Roseibacterium sp. SDUM158017]MDG4648857.1 GNAT family N-acetyltransferase [Roseibacterium sp. SDUM158017]